MNRELVFTLLFLAGLVLAQDEKRSICSGACGSECRDSCGTGRFRACCFNYLKKRGALTTIPWLVKTKSESTQDLTDITADEDNPNSPARVSEETSRNSMCYVCGDECYYTCFTHSFRLCCFSYLRKRNQMR